MPTLPLSACTPPSFCTRMTRLWFFPDFHVSSPEVFAMTAPTPMAASAIVPTAPNMKYLCMSILPMTVASLHDRANVHRFRGRVRG